MADMLLIKPNIPARSDHSPNSGQVSHKAQEKSISPPVYARVTLLELWSNPAS